jgi:Flp pilus assembly protein protease CpaA
MPHSPVLVWSALIVLLASIAAWTDCRNRKIYNWLTLPGALLGPIGQGLLFGREGVYDSFWGWFAVGGLMVLALVLFANVGGGDVKLMAMLGSLLGLHLGLEVLLWTCTLAVIEAIALILWTLGAGGVLHSLRIALVTRWKTGVWPEATDDLNAMLSSKMRFAPAALGAVLIVLGRNLTNLAPAT